MRLHFKILVAVLLMSSTYSHAQDYSFFIEFNYNTFSHSGLKNFQNEFIADVTEVKLVKNDEFPGNSGFTIGSYIEHINTSFFVSYTSTGGKASYSDYSGTIRIAEAVYGITLGGEYLIDLFPDDTGKGNFDLGLRGFLTFSDLEVETYFELFDQSENDSIGFSSLDFGGGIRGIYEYPVSFFKLRLTLGFDVVIGGKYFLKENKEFHLEDNSGDPVKNGWTGLRSGLGISIPF